MRRLIPILLAGLFAGAAAAQPPSPVVTNLTVQGAIVTPSISVTGLGASLPVCTNSQQTLSTVGCPPATGTVTGPTTSTPNDFAFFKGTAGTSIIDGGAPGTAAFVNIGTSGATIPLLSTANTWTGAQTAPSFVTGNTTFSDGNITRSTGNTNITTPGNITAHVGSGNNFLVNDSVHGNAFIVGGASANITGILTLTPGQANTPLFLSAGASSFANQSIAFEPVGYGQINFYQPSMTGTYVPQSNTFNCSGFTANVTVATCTDTLNGNAAAAPYSLGIIRYAGGAGTTGGRTALQSDMILGAATSDTNKSSFYAAAVFDTEMRANAGGTPSAPFGNAFGFDSYARLENGATNFLSVASHEFDISIEAGASASRLYGPDLVLLSTNAVEASLESVGFGVGGQVGALATIRCAFCAGVYDGINAITSDGVIVGIHPNGFSGPGPSIAYGDDYRLGTFSGSALGENGGDVFSNGSVRIGRTYITDSSSGLVITPSGSVGSLSSIAAGGTGYTISDANFKDPYGGIWQVTAINVGASNTVTGVTLLRAPSVSGATPSNPITLTPISSVQPGTGLTINIAWATGTNVNVAGTLKTSGYTVGTLPTSTVGTRTYVTDATSCTFGSTPAGGASTFCPVIYTGSAWIEG